VASRGPANIKVEPGGSSYINVSSRMMNEVVVPYANPKVVRFLKPSSKASVQQDGSSIYVSTADEDFVQLIVKDGDAPAAAGFSVTLIPVEDIPGQHIVLQTAAGQGGTVGGSGATGLSSSDYEDQLRELLRDAAREAVPGGYARDAKWLGPQLQIGPVAGLPLFRLVGANFAIEYYELVNTGATRVELVEPNFKQPGVRAIAFTKDVLLAPGQTGRMVWVRDRER
jgi:hypothetical protein